MLSLGREKKSNIINDVNSTENFITIPIPIYNVKKNNINNIDEYALNYNNFNPSKMSPPDLWKTRLQQRLQNHYSFNTLNE